MYYVLKLIRLKTRPVEPANKETQKYNILLIKENFP